MADMGDGPTELEALFREVGSPIYRRCLKILRRPADAADATQEVFVRLLKHQDRLPPAPERLRFAYAVATRICLNRLRDSAWETPANEAGPQGEDLLASPQPGMEWVADRQLAARVLSSFDEETRAIAWLVLVDGHTQEEAGSLLDLSRKTVGKKLNAFLDGSKRLLSKEVA